MSTKRKTDIMTLIEAMHILAEDVQSEDGVANAAIREAAERLEELQAQHRKDDDEYAKLWQMYGDLEDKCDQLQEGHRLIKSFTQDIIANADNPNHVRTRAGNIIRWIDINARGVPEETHKRWVDVMAEFWRVQNEIRDYVMRWEEDNDE